MTAAAELTVADATASTKSLLTEVTTVRMRPRYEGSNICTWIGFKHVLYLVEEAVLVHFAQCGLPSRRLYEDLGLGLDIVDLDTRILHALHQDDVAEAEVVPATGDGDGTLGFRVTLRVDRGGEPVKAVTAKVRLSLRADTYLTDQAGPDGAAAQDGPGALDRFTVRRLGAHRPTPVEPAPAEAEAALASGAGRDAVLAALTAGRNAYAWAWTIPYTYCHFNERLQMSGFVRLMEEAKDRFVYDRGISIKTLLDDRKWIPVVPRASLTVLDEALMEEDLYSVYTVEEIFKDFTYTSRLDHYAARDGRLVPVATGRIVHGYAVIGSRRDWSLVSFDERVLHALGGKPDLA